MDGVRVDKQVQPPASQNRRAAEPLNESAPGKPITSVAELMSSASKPLTSLPPGGPKPLSMLGQSFPKPPSMLKQSFPKPLSMLRAEAEEKEKLAAVDQTNQKEKGNTAENGMPEQKAAMSPGDVGVDTPVAETEKPINSAGETTDTAVEEQTPDEKAETAGPGKETESPVQNESTTVEETEKSAETGKAEKTPGPVKETEEAPSEEHTTMPAAAEKQAGGGEPAASEKAGQTVSSGEGKEDKEEKGEEEEKEEEGPAPVKADYENPPAVKEPPLNEAKDKEGETVAIDEAAHMYITGLAAIAQQFRDQGKDSYDKAIKAKTIQQGLEKDTNAAKKKVAASDKALDKSQKNVNQRESKVPYVEKALDTSEERQQKVGSEAGGFKKEADSNKSTVKKLTKESGSLLSGSRKHEDPKEPDTGTLGKKLSDLSSGSVKIEQGVTGAGNKSSELAAEAKAAKKQNATAEKDVKETKSRIAKAKDKLNAEQKRNSTAGKELNSVKPALGESKKVEQNLEKEGMGLIDASVAIENDLNVVQHDYYKEMKTVEGRKELSGAEESFFEGELSNENPLLMQYVLLKSESDRDAFVEKLNPEQRAQLSAGLQSFSENADDWIEAKQEEFGKKIERKYEYKVTAVNTKRNQALDKPMGVANKNFDRISKAGLFWSSLGKSLSGIWTSITNVSFADIGHLGLAMVNPLETWKTISGAVGSIWKDLSDWGGFSKDPVGMILKKGASVANSLLTITGVITGILGVLTIAATVAAVFSLGAAAGIAIWLGGATITMGTITFWVAAAALALNVLSGIKNIYDLHSAKTADVLIKETHDLKQDTAGAMGAVMGMVGAKGTVSGGKLLKETVRKEGKAFGKIALNKLKNNIISLPGRTVKSVSSLFKKDTWKGLYKGFLRKGKKSHLAEGEIAELEVPKARHALAHDEKVPASEHPLNGKKIDEPETHTSKKSETKKQPEPSAVEKDPEIDELKKHEGNVDESSKKKMKEEADHEIPDGPNRDSKRKALTAAKIITEANDKIDAPIPVLHAELMPLLAFKGVRGFGEKDRGNGHYKIVMYGSENDVTKGKDYTTSQGKDKDSNKNDDIGGEKGSINDVKNKSENLNTIKKNSEDWKDAMEEIKGLGKGKKDFRVESASEAIEFLKEAKGNMNRYKNYARKTIKYDKGYEFHNVQNEIELGVGNDLQHIKWYDGKSSGHIFFNKPN